ncbi:TPA: hypothetical protein ACGCBD_002873 [Pseudomonas aeruginosa]|uniref:hypothetical protein n=1 Tax=Pseudomonas aeruginosa TaxID=287 RepID=UPI000995445D|nr:hypothetical protein [Pseudomonas aeruginosa]MCQ9744153.1 hypothetical protein [Pseudomonas aeruginosa]MDU3632659.1 hypothetical protein [Pseudomonas aeruginosa]HBN9937490.1 hypothetical protein [Pseudomonas aeruginosa]HBO4551281.1 hypothetical protein [Pseudomonas aeruginosa]HCF6419939.1 hypothetical protein [Pseudomonas aeruginosa]
MEQAMREEFEAWVRTQVPEPSLATVLAYSAGNDLYLNPHIQGRYEGWKASRAALNVRLPKPYGSSSLDAYPELAEFNRGIRECLAALQQAGIEVAE